MRRLGSDSHLVSRLPRFHDVSVRLLRGLEYLPGSRIRLEPSVARFRLDSPEIQALSRTVLATRQARCQQRFVLSSS